MKLVASTDYARNPQPFLLGRKDDDPTLAEVRAPQFTRSASELRLTLYATLLAADILYIAMGFLLAGTMRLGSPLEHQPLRTLAIILPTFIAVALNSGVYSLEALRRPSYGARKAAEALLCASAVAVGLLFYAKAGEQFSRLIFATGTLLSLLFVLTGRISVGNYLGRKHRWKFSNELVIADDAPVPPLGDERVISAREFGIEPGTDDPLVLNRLSFLLDKCERVVVACPPERRASWTRALKGTNLSVEVCMPELTRMGAIGIGTFRDDKTVVVSCGPLSLRDRLVKRTLDLVVAMGALLFLAPLMLAVAIAVVGESRGPILFRQPRVGQNNRIFWLLKFRSMRAECTDQKGRTSVCVGDDRLTSIGKFIRATSIDELPQLFNVIRGDMSIVGPRPHALGSTAEDNLFWEIDARYFDRHAIKPGITGLAQVRGFRGATISREDLTSRLQSDLEYVAGWSIWRDLKILCATFRVLVHPNAF